MNNPLRFIDPTGTEIMSTGNGGYYNTDNGTYTPPGGPPPSPSSNTYGGGDTGLTGGYAPPSDPSDPSNQGTSIYGGYDAPNDPSDASNGSNVSYVYAFEEVTELAGFQEVRNDNSRNYISWVAIYKTIGYKLIMYPAKESPSDGTTNNNDTTSPTVSDNANPNNGGSSGYITDLIFDETQEILDNLGNQTRVGHYVINNTIHLETLPRFKWYKSFLRAAIGIELATDFYEGYQIGRDRSLTLGQKILKAGILSAAVAIDIGTGVIIGSVTAPFTGGVGGVVLGVATTAIVSVGTNAAKNWAYQKFGLD